MSAESIKIGPRRLSIRWSDGQESSFHHMWLRDACTCPRCGDPTFGTKEAFLANLPDELAPLSATLTPDGQLVVRWPPDDHESVYEESWLRARAYDPATRRARQMRPRHWTTDLRAAWPSFAYDRVAGDEYELYRLLVVVRDFGLSFVTEVPPEPGGLEKFASLIGYLRENNYGRAFDIVTHAAADNFASLAVPNLPHTDDAFRPSPPGLLMLHCVQTSADGGGASIFLDGFELAARLRAADPTAFDLLCRVPLQFRRHHPKAHDLRSHGRVIRLDFEGNVAGVRFATHNATPPDIPDNLIEPFYAAYRTLVRLYLDESHWLVRLLRPGQLALIDNERVLHGRTAFTAIGERHLRGGCVERDAFHSRLRILARRFGVDSPDAHFVTGSGT